MSKKKRRFSIVATLLIAVVIISALVTAWLWGAFEQSCNPAQDGITEAKGSNNDDMTTELYCLISNVENIVIDADSGLPFVNNEVLLFAADGVSTSEIETLAGEYGGEVVGFIKAVNQYQLQFSDTYSYAELDSLIQRIGAEGHVRSADFNIALHLDDDSDVTTDSEWSGQWSDTPSGINWNAEAINAPGAWEYLEQIKEAGPIGIGVYDSQFYAAHEDLSFAGTWMNTFNEEKSSHGTHVAGTISAIFNNGIGIAGISPNNDNLLYGVSNIGLSNQSMPGDNSKKYTTLMAFECGFAYLIAEKHCSVVNVSMSCPLPAFAASRGNLNAIHYLALLNDRFGKYLQLLIESGHEFVVCKAAGNLNLADNDKGQIYFRTDDVDSVEMDNADYSFGYVPYTDEYEKIISKYDNIEDRIECGNVNAEYDFINGIQIPSVKDRVIVVGAIGQTAGQSDGIYDVAGFSQTGKRVDVLAPGVLIHSTVWDHGSGYENIDAGGRGWDGTSMAAPHVSGIAAMVFGVNPDLTGADVKRIICDTAKGDYVSYVNGADYHHSLVDAKAAVENAINYGKEFVAISTGGYAGNCIFVKTSPRDIEVRNVNNRLVQTISAQEDFGAFITNGTVIYYMLSADNIPSIWTVDLKSGKHEELTAISEHDLSEVLNEVNSWDAWDTHLKYGLSAGNDRYLYFQATWETYTYMSKLYSLDLETYEVSPGDSLGHLTETNGKVIFSDLQTSVQSGTLTIMDSDGTNKVELRDVWSYEVIGDEVYYLEEQRVSGGGQGNNSAVYLKKCGLNGENMQNVSGRLAVGFSFSFRMFSEHDIYISYWSYDSSMQSKLAGFMYNYDTGNQYTLDEASRCSIYHTKQGNTYLYEAVSGNVYLFNSDIKGIERIHQYSETTGACGNIFNTGGHTYLVWYYSDDGISAEVHKID